MMVFAPIPAPPPPPPPAQAADHDHHDDQPNYADGGAFIDFLRMQHDGGEDFHLARTVKTTLRNVPQRCREVWSRCADVAARAQRESGDYDPWRHPDPRREYVLSIAFANQVGDAIMVRGADARRRRNRSGGRYATGARA